MRDQLNWQGLLKETETAMFGLGSSPLYAHDLAAELYEPLPEGLFDYKMDWDPTLGFFVLLALLYRQGLRSVRGRQLPRWQVACFYTGIAANMIALAPPIDPLADRLFFVHMIQHMILVQIGSPLMMLGIPFVVVLRGIGPTWRRLLVLPLLRSRVLRRMQRFLLTPLVSLVGYVGNYWFWHIPRFYDWALLNDGIHLIEHALMAFFSFFLWRNIIDPHPMRCRLAMGTRLIYLGAIMVLNAGLAAGLTYSETVWYAYQGIPMPLWWAQRWSHLDDQRLGGLIMWIPGGFLTLVTMTLCFFVWVRREANADRRRMLARGLPLVETF